MIQVKIIKKDNFYKQIDIIGHANYDLYGKDIVCASISSIITTTVNGILSFDKTIEYNESKDLFKIIVLKEDETTNKLLLNMINLLKELEISYSKNIKILEEE